MIIAGIYWLYDSFTAAIKRKKMKVEEPVVVSYARGIFLILAVIIMITVFNISILLLLVILTFGSLIIWMIDKAIFERRRKMLQGKEPLLVDYARSLFPVFLIVLLIRSFVAQPFRVPTGSLEPTIMPNDLLLVSQFSYGLRLPVIQTKILNIGEPKRGDIVVFSHPAVPGMDLIKRVIGIPGDHIIYKNKVLYINGQIMQQTFIKNGYDVEPGMNISVKVMEEDLGTMKHRILIYNQGGETTDFNFTVPQGYYFMMGDNRDNSADSRVWGFMPEKNIIGKAEVIFFSWDHGIQWSRIGDRL